MNTFDPFAEEDLQQKEIKTRYRIHMETGKHHNLTIISGIPLDYDKKRLSKIATKLRKICCSNCAIKEEEDHFILKIGGFHKDKLENHLDEIFA
jgi:translation initiation factor 1 (eIF-1/SUI1)